MRWPYTDTLPLVLRSMHVGDDFTKSIEAVLRKQIFDADGFRLEQTQNSAPPVAAHVRPEFCVEEEDGGSDSDVEKLAGSIMFPPHHEFADAAPTLLYQCAEHHSRQRVVLKL